jgi:hypothetical protein
MFLFHILNCQNHRKAFQNHTQRVSFITKKSNPHPKRESHSECQYHTRVCQYYTQHVKTTCSVLKSCLCVLKTHAVGQNFTERIERMFIQFMCVYLNINQQFNK